MTRVARFGLTHKSRDCDEMERDDDFGDWVRFEDFVELCHELALAEDRQRQDDRRDARLAEAAGL